MGFWGLRGGFLNPPALRSCGVKRAWPRRGEKPPGGTELNPEALGNRSRPAEGKPAGAESVSQGLSGGLLGLPFTSAQNKAALCQKRAFPQPHGRPRSPDLAPSSLRPGNPGPHHSPSPGSGVGVAAPRLGGVRCPALASRPPSSPLGEDSVSCAGPQVRPPLWPLLGGPGEPPAPIVGEPFLVLAAGQRAGLLPAQKRLVSNLHHQVGISMALKLPDE